MKTAQKKAPPQQRIILNNAGIINPESIADCINAGGYEAAKKALKLAPAEIVRIVTDSELRGRGGAGFPTGTKWSAAAQQKSDFKYLVCNADEGEPGTFKDREIMEKDPHKLVEGMIIAAYAVGTRYGYIYVRGEYAVSIARLKKAIEAAREKGFLGENIAGSGFSFDMEVLRGAGAYICGEESALIESIEGKRGEPRKKPPYPVQEGLWGKPTVVNNVETLANIPPIIANGAEWYKAIGVAGSRGTKLFSLMGDINMKGVVEIPFGMPLSKIIRDYGGGVKGGRKIKAVILGGVSGSLLTPAELDTPVDFSSLSRIEAGPGSGAIIVLDEKRSVLDAVQNIAHFFKHESCGKCVPCRMGTAQISGIMDDFAAGKADAADLEKLSRLARTLALTSFCPLGQTAPNILAQALKKYKGEWTGLIKKRK